jgi:ABC-type multidrug transport system fused ATPase/permease subunit
MLQTATVTVQKARGGRKEETSMITGLPSLPEPGVNGGADSDDDSGVPMLWSGRRRRHLSLLILVGFGQAAAAGVGAQLLSHALMPSGASTRGLLFGFLVAAAVTVGLLRMAERVLAERLGQDYVHEIRLGLVRRSLHEGRVTSLSVAVARTTSDLTSVKSWVSQGVAPLAAGVPLTIGAGIALILLDPLLSIGVLVPAAILILAMRMLAPVADRRSRTVRRQRGRLSSQVADTLLPTAAIRSTCMADLELQRVDKYGQSLALASIERAKVMGAMGGAAAAVSGIAAAMVIGAGLFAGLPTSTIAGALAMVAFLAAPINDLGRVVEYRHSYRAARRDVGLTDSAGDSALDRIRVSAVPRAHIGGAVAVAYLELSDGTTMPDLAARPGERIVVDAGNQRLTSEVLQRFVGLREGCVGEIVVGGKNLAVARPQDFGQLVGYAARGMMLVRASVAQAVRYRCPDAGPEEVNRVLAAVDLFDRVFDLPMGADTVLVRGGEPLTIPEQARLLLARAILDDPPLLVLDHLDADLGEAGRTMLRRVLADYPGVVILASDDPDQIVIPTHIWRTDGLERIAPMQTVG